MFAPLAIPIIMGVTAAIAAGTAAYGGVQAKDQADTQAKIAKQQANYATQSAAANEAEYRLKQDRLMATRRALLGATGVDPGSGSPLLASEDFASEAELQALKIRQGGKVESTRLQQQASLLKQQGQQEQFAGFLKGGSLLLGGAGDVLGQLNNPYGAPAADQTDTATS